MSQRGTQQDLRNFEATLLGLEPDQELGGKPTRLSENPVTKTSIMNPSFHPNSP
jgi:hypothetical protein